MDNLAPIVLFVYNRPDHTEQTLSALEKNELASESVLHIYADGAKTGANQKDLEFIDQVKKVISKPWKFKKIKIIERDRNFGLADNIVDGVTTVVNQHGKIIVLEDDIVTSPGFLTYMNDALTLYEEDEQVMHISGYMFPIKEKLPNTFFYNTASCWGWGTWSRAWRNYNRDAYELLQELYDKNKHHEFDLNGAHRFTDQLIQNITKVKKTWAVKWYASFFLMEGAALHPYPSYTKNIGLDDSGENCSEEMLQGHDWIKLNSNNVKLKKIDNKDDHQVRSIMASFYKQENKKDHFRSTTSQLIPPALLKFYRQLRYGKSEIPPLEGLKALPRFKSGKIELNDILFEYPDASSFAFMFDEIFNQQIYQFNLSKKQPRFIDGGANIGLATIYLKKKFPSAKVTAFEPDSTIFSYLQKNVLNAGVKDVELIRKGLWKEEARLSFSSDGADGGRIESERNTNTIETVLLSSYISESIDFLKLDIEGAEVDVLREIEHKLHLVEKLFIEYHSFEEKQQELAVILKILEDHKFRYHINSPGLSSSSPLLHLNRYMGMDMQLNIYAWKEK